MNPAGDMRGDTTAIVIHESGHAHAALAAAAALRVQVTLVSAPGAAAYAGPGWFCEVLRAARAVRPEAEALGLLDCGTRAGDVLAALRTGIEGVIFTGRGDVADKLASLAGAHGVAFRRTRPAAHDLLAASDPQAACRRWLDRR